MQSRPLDPGAVIARALEIYREHAGVLIPAALALFAVQAIATILLGPSLGVVVSVLSLVLGTIYQGMVVELVRDVQDGRRDASVGQLFGSVGPVVLTLLVVGIIVGVCTAIGFVLLIAPGLYVLTIFSVAAPVVVLERAGVLGALRRSQELVRGNGWSVFMVVLVVFVGLNVLSVVVAIIVGGLGDVGGAVVQWLFNAAITPLSGVTAAVLYLALRERAGEPPVDAGAGAGAGGGAVGA